MLMLEFEKYVREPFDEGTNLVTCNGKSQTIKDWAKERGMSYDYLYYQLFKSKPRKVVEEALGFSCPYGVGWEVVRDYVNSRKRQQVREAARKAMQRLKNRL